MLTAMGRVLEERLLSRRFEGPHHEALLNIMVAGSHLRGLLDGAFADAGLTQGQYNVLRILNGAHPEGHARGEIARRMLDRAPDLTRMLDRLIAAGFVRRARDGADARQSIAYITPKGRRLIEKMQGVMNQVTRDIQSRLSATEAKTLSKLCEKVYAPVKQK